MRRLVVAAPIQFSHCRAMTFPIAPPAADEIHGASRSRYFQCLHGVSPLIFRQSGRGDCQLLRRFRASWLRSTICLELGSSIAAAVSRLLNVRETVSIVTPR